MSMFEKVARECIFIDFGAELHYGSDQMDLNYPVRFATVTFQLMGNGFLTELVDRMRLDRGFVPLYPMDGYDYENCDHDGWYDFFVGINDLDRSKVDPCIEATVCNSTSVDEGESYMIELTPEEQDVLFECLDGQCRKHLGKGCDVLLDEARKEMENEDYQERRERNPV